MKIEVFLAEGQTSRAINVPIQNSNMAPVLSVETAINGILLAAEVNNDASGFTAENDNLNNNEIKKAKRILNDHNAFGYSIARNETVSGHDYTITTYHEDGRVARTAKIHNVNQPQDLVFMALELHETTSRRYGEIQRVTPEFISSQAPKPAQITQAVSAANDMRDYYAAFEQNQRAIEAAQREEHPRRGRPPRTHNLRIADQYVSVVGGTSVEPNHSNTIADNNITNSTNPNAGDPATSVDPTVLSPNTQPTTGAPLADPAIATPANPAITISGNPTTGSGIADPFQLTPLSDPIPIRVKAVPKMNNNVMAMGFTPDYDDDFDNPPPDESKPTPEEIIIPDEENEVRPPNMEELPPVDSPAQDVPPGSPDQEHGNRNPDTDVSTRQVNNPEPSVPPSTRPAPAVTPPAPSEPDYDNEPDPLNTQAENDEPGSSSEPGEQADDADSLPPAADDEIVVDENNTDPVTVDGNDGQETGSPENTRGFDTALPTDGQELRIPDTLNGLWLPTPDEMNGPQLDWRTIAANDPDIQRFAQTLDDLIRLVGPEETDKLLVETLNDINHEQNPPGNSDEPSPSNPDADPDDIQDLDDVFKNISEDDKSFPDWLQSLINKGELTPEEAQQILDTMVPPENVVLDTTNNGQEIKLNEPDISSYIELLNLQTPEEIERFKRETLPIIQERLETPLEPENPGSVVIDPTPGQGDPDGADNEPEVIPEDGSNVADGEPDRSTPIDAEEFDAITRKMELEIFRILGGGTTIEESTTPSIEETSGRATINPDIINPTPPENPVRGPGGSGDVPPNNPPTDNVHISQAVGGRSSSASSGLVGTVMGVQGTIAQLEKLELNKGAAKLGGVKQLYYSQASLGLNVTATGAGVVTLVDDISALRNSLKATTPLTQLSTSGALRYLGPASIVISGVAAGFDAQAAEEANDGYAQAGAYAGFAGGTLAGLGTGYLGEAVIGGMALLGAAPPVLIGAGIIWGGYTIYNTVLGSQIAADYAQETIGKDWQKEYDQKAKQQAAEIQKDVDRIVAEYKSSVDSVKAYMKAHDDLLSACNGNNIQNIKKAQKQYEAAYKKLGEANGLDSADIEYLSGLNDNLLLAQYREKTRTVPVNHTDAERRRQENLGDINKSIVQIRNLTDESNKLNEAHFSDEAKGAREKEHKNLIAGAEQRIGIIRASQKQKKFADAISEIYSGNKGKPDAPGIVNSQDNIALEETARKELTEKYEQGKLSRADITKFKEEADKNREAQIKDMENLLAAEEKLKKLKEQQQKEKDPYSKQYAEDSIKAIDKVLAQIEVYKNTIVNENKLTDATFAKMNEYVTLNEVLNSQPTLNNDAKEKVSLAINDAKTVIDRDIINVEEFKDINKTIKANQDLLQQDSKTLTDFVTRIEELEKSLTQPENQQKAGTVRTEVKTHQGGVDQANTITDEEMNRMREELFSRVLMFDNDVTVMLDKQGRVSSYTDANGEWNLFFDPKDRPQLGDRLGNITSAVSQDMDNTPLVLVMKDEKGNTIITNLGEPYQADKQGDKDYFKLSDATKAFKKAEIALGEKYEDNSLDNSGNNNQNRDVREFLSRNAKEINFAISGLNAQLSAAQADGVNDKEKGDLNKQIEDINNRLKLNLKLNFNKDNQYEIISQPQLPKIVNPLEEVKGRN